MNNQPVTTAEFIYILTSQENSIHKGRLRGWLEDEDERFADQLITRRNAARILHQYMKIESGVSDLADISDAEVLQDLYTCRVCANHIAQIFVRGIMESREVEHCGKIIQIFDQTGLVTEGEARDFVSKIKL